MKYQTIEKLTNSYNKMLNNFIFFYNKLKIEEGMNYYQKKFNNWKTILIIWIMNGLKLEMEWNHLSMNLDFKLMTEKKKWINKEKRLEDQKMNM